MTKTKIRIFLSLLLLVISIRLLVWSLQPVDSQLRRVPIRQEDLTYPTPVGYREMERRQL
ncbi:MAG: hypothetical protein JXA13_14820 [Anaerolineales bacterium]|nr:hypothetical protein [Anaerolineales bacterium]